MSNGMTIPDQEKIEARIKKATCQEASILSVNTYIPCAAPAVAIVCNRDVTPYFMCGACAGHNIHNRGAVLIARLKGE